VRCEQCGGENPDSGRFCQDCGAAMSAACPACGGMVLSGARFCGACGSPLKIESGLPGPVGPRPVDSGSPSLLEGEYKPVTVLFCDIVGSTALTERWGPEDMQRLLSRFFELSVVEVERYGGTVNKFLGDGFMALVGVPAAHEDHARRAVLAALAIQERLREDGYGGDDAELRVRMGLNTGRTLVGSLGAGRSLDYTVVGDTANVAARLQQLAQPGAIVVSEATARLVAGYVRLEPLGSVQVRGRTESVTAFQVTGVARRRSPSDPGDHPALTRFVGRSRHLATLRDLFDEACEGQGQVVGVVGEPGIGKTRLVTEFRRSLGHARATLLEGRCLSYASATPYLPLLDLLRANCAIVEGEAAEVTQMKVRVALSEVGLDPDDRAPYLLHLLGVPRGTETLADVSAEAVKTRTFETLLQMSLRGARRRPLVFVIEDLHWVDRTSEEFLASLADSLGPEPMMLLATYRPGYQPPWTGRSYATQLSLPRLAPGHCRELVRSLLPSQVADEAEVVVRRGEGNPFFLEELARAPGGNGNGSTPVPDTVEGVLMARIDRLPDDARGALQTASVLGREFSTELLRGVWDGADLDAHLLELKRLEFLHELGDRDEQRYAFKHALIQEVAYESLLSVRRRGVHAAAARALESLYRGRLERVYDRLADHWYRADEAEPAVEFLSRFAAQAASAYAHVEASEALRKALAQVGRLPENMRTRRRVELVLALARSLYFMGRFHESIALLSEHEHEASGLADPDITAPYRFWLAHTQSHLGEGHLEAVRHARAALAEAERAADSATIGKAHYVLSREGFWSGELAVGAEHGRQAVRWLERAGERWWLAQSHSWWGINLFQQGDFEAALGQAARAGEIGRALGDLRLESYAAFLSGWFRTTRGDWEAGIRDCTRSLELSPDPLSGSLARCILGFAYREKGDYALAIEHLGRAIEEQNAFGYRRNTGMLEAWLGEAHLWVGRTEEATRHAREALEAGERMGTRVVQAAARRALGRIAAAEGELVRAEAELGEALARFDAAGARFEAGVTHLSLAELARRRGDRGSEAARVDAAIVLFTSLDAPVYLERARLLRSGARVGSGRRAE
jgi:class 3 adenylate cyclase/tetratricopeptide (TPR) repeat protein